MKSLWIWLSCFLLATSAAQARELKPYQGTGPTPPLVLKDLAGKEHKLSDYRGQVVLVNFWATWCPPCRAEMPSMQRLKEKMAGKPFTILAVDMGETEQQVHAFKKQVKFDFPVLMDKDGKALKEWRVFAFPTSYVVGPDGKIKYALFGSIEWDEPAQVEKISGLLPRQSGKK